VIQPNIVTAALAAGNEHFAFVIGGHYCSNLGADQRAGGSTQIP
jgi:hypothetical protein